VVYFDRDCDISKSCSSPSLYAFSVIILVMFTCFWNFTVNVPAVAFFELLKSLLLIHKLQMRERMLGIV